MTEVCDKLDFDLEFWQTAEDGTEQHIRLTRESCELSCYIIDLKEEQGGTEELS